MPMKMFDIGKAYSDAESIKGMRSRNQLAEQLGPLQVEGQQIQNRMGQMQLDQASQPKPVDPEDMARAVEWADTPEKWNTAIDTFVAEGNAGFEKYRDQFHRRDEFKALIAAETEKADPKSPLGKLARDFENGIISEADYRAGISKATTAGPLVTVNTGDRQTGQMTASQAGKRTSEALDAKASATSAISEVEATLRKLSKAPEAVGIQGELIEKVGGLLQQVPVLGDAAGEWLNTKEVQATRTQVKSLIGKFVKPITGDTSGRYSDRDMQLVTVASRANDPLASIEDVTAALNAIKEITQRDYARANLKLANIPDITSSVGIEEYANILRLEHPDWDNGKIVEFIVSERQKYGVPAEREY